jgi:hypothetical protein
MPVANVSASMVMLFAPEPETGICLNTLPEEVVIRIRAERNVSGKV